MKIDIIIDENGKATVSVNGVIGPACGQVTKELEGMLGIVTKDTKTAEFFQTAQQQQTATQKKG